MTAAYCPQIRINSIFEIYPFLHTGFGGDGLFAVLENDDVR
jgi:hypothetical protein